MATQPLEQQEASKQVFVSAGAVFTKKLPASSIRAALGQMPKAELVELSAHTGGGLEKVEEFKTVRVTMPDGKVHYVYCPRLRYRVVQHSEAFEPVIAGLTGFDFDFMVRATPGRADLRIFSQKAGYDGVQLGISIKNSFDGSTMVSYGFDMTHETTVIELVGYRQVCSNGMKIRVPLNEAELVKLEERTTLQELIKTHRHFVHTQSAQSKIARMQEFTEALAVMKAPVERLIKKGQAWKLRDTQLLEDLIKVYVGKRQMQKVIAQFAQEEQTIWGLYNAITNMTSHDNDMKESVRENLNDKAAQLLLHPFVSQKAWEQMLENVQETE